MLALDPDLELAHVIQLLAYHQQRNTLEMIGEHAESPSAHDTVLALE
jgi:hypothetical protein